MTRHSYYVVMQDYGRKGRESITDPEITRAGVVSRIQSGEYKNIAFIHHVAVDEDGIGSAVDCTNEILKEAGFYQEAAQ